MPSAVPAAALRPVETRLIAALFVLALGFNGWAVSAGWWHANLPGHEFRQTQTAVSATFIQREHNFSLAYPTPILGKPWSVPFEFPLYQWTVVVTSNATGLPITQAGRLVSILCFYLTLPALYLLLRRLKVAPAHCLVALSFVVLCPLYIFYARAVLIETMALMFGCWYAVTLPLALEKRRLGWLLLVNAAGAGAGLVKVTTFLIFLAPAFVWSLHQLWLARPGAVPRDWKPLLRTFGWLVAAHAGAFLATYWWVHFADAVKALNLSARDLQSAGLTSWNFGTGRRFDPELWSGIWKIVSQEITPPGVLLAGGALAAVLGHRRRWVIAGLMGLWAGVLLTFPLLYALHDYYHVAAAFLPMLALGLATAAVFQNARLPRVLAFGLWSLLLANQALTFLDFHYPRYRDAGSGGSLADSLKEVLRPDEVIVVAGDDWSSIFPFFTGRRALMIRSGWQDDHAYLRSAFAGLKGEDVGALVLFEDQEENAPLIQLARETFDLGPQPLLRWRHGGRRAVAYLPRRIQPDALVELGRTNGFANLKINPAALAGENPLAGRQTDYASLLKRHQRYFASMHPRPVRFYSSFRPELWNAGQPDKERFAANPDLQLRFALKPGRHRLRTDLGLEPGAWENVKPADASDGVGLIARACFPDGRAEILHELTINPAANPAERGPRFVDWTFDLLAGAELELAVTAGPAGNGARDWASLGPVRIE
jgi:hypothetical protein